MKEGSHLSSGRLGWLMAALLFGILAGGGIAWLLIRPHAEQAPVVIYQVPTAAPTPTPALADDNASSLRRRHHAVHPAEDLPAVIEHAAPTPPPDLAAGLDGAATPDAPTPDGRQTVLVDGIAITHPPALAVPTATPLPRRVVYDLNSAGVADSVALAIDGIAKYIQKGYNLREDTWGGELAIGRAKAITHQLFKGNDYWFGMGCSVAGSTVRVRLYDSEGNPADGNYWQHEASDGSCAAAEIQCQHTGTYFVVVSLESAPESRVPWGVVYAYR